MNTFYTLSEAQDLNPGTYLMSVNTDPNTADPAIAPPGDPDYIQNLGAILVVHEGGVIDNVLDYLTWDTVTTYDYVVIDKATARTIVGDLN